jgi:TM2 domain-containing membrane protein YozV
MQVREEKERVIAAMLCFFLGGLGVHKFYLRQTAAGVIYLLFFWTCIPSIIAFFEFLVLCFMSDREFNARYNSLLNPAEDQRQIRSATESTDTMYKLKKMYDDGLITAEEYEEKRRKLLNDI